MLTCTLVRAISVYVLNDPFRDAARPRTHAVTIVRCHRGGRYVPDSVDFSACQATAGASSVERSCSPAVRTGLGTIHRPYLGCVGAGPVAADLTKMGDSGRVAVADPKRAQRVPFSGGKGGKGLKISQNLREILTSEKTITLLEQFSTTGNRIGVSW